MEAVLLDNKLLAVLSNLFSALKNEGKVNEADQRALVSMIANKLLHVVLADDDEDDREFFKEAMQTIAPSVRVTTAIDGIDMFSILEKYANDLPDLIFLDLNMPCKNGFECLEELKLSDKWKDIPVLIYSTTANFEQVNLTYQKGANLFIQKPHSYDGIKKMLKKIFEFDLQALFLQPLRENFVFK